MPVATYYLHDPAAPRPNSPTRMGNERPARMPRAAPAGAALGLRRMGPARRAAAPRGERGVRHCAGAVRGDGLRLPEAAFTRVRVVDDADRIASYQDGTVWRMVIVLFRAQLPQEPELHCSRESCTLRFLRRRSCARRTLCRRTVT